MAKVVKHLLSKYELLNSNPGTSKNKKKRKNQSFSSSPKAGEKLMTQYKGRKNSLFMPSPV
jgi:hypothetical protein